MTDKDIQKSLEQDARVVKERMPETMTQAKAKQVAGALKTFLHENDWSQKKFAEAIGVSSAQISQFLRNKYTGDLESLINKVVGMINTVGRKQKRIKYRVFVDTTVAKRIFTLITQTEAFSSDEGKIGIVVGDGGHGKSECMKQYAKTNKNTIYVQLDDAMTSTAMFAEIATAVGVDSSGSLNSVTRRLIEALVNRNMIVMLDEASGLRVKQLNQLRQIIAVKCRCPLILAGNTGLLKTVMQPTTRRGAESLDQFTSRLMGIVNLDELASDNDGGLYTVDDVRKLYEFGKVSLKRSAINAIQKICQSPRSGRLRTCSHIIEALHTTPTVEKKGYIDAALIVAAIDQLDLPVRVYLPVGAEAFREDQSEDTAQRAAG